MTNFKITAQSYTDSRRIAKVVSAKTEAEAIRSVSSELESAGFYLLSAIQQA